ncbi:MAG: PLP-dependent aminotransferase family protein [Chloroflexota bacterium]|nr:PLP-dependent aminotransferase family protein [Chloroflexota bacterium]MDE2684371.1 PLP-dependent aminotransferase family protein [Chloroflexota bacterium]
MTTSLPSLLISISDGVIDLGWGHPSPRLHPTDALAAAAQSVLGQQSAVPLQYGAVQGFGPLLESLAAYLSTQDSYGGPVAPDSMFLTAGASAAIDLATTLYATAGDTVIVEEPTYYLIGQIFIDHGLNVVGVPTDGDGLDTNALADLLASAESPRPELLYTIPTYQNPNGSVLPLHRRRQLIELAQRYGFTIIADEVYQLLHYGAPPPPPMAMLDDSPGGCVVSLGSFSKVLSPGLRLGWVHAAPEIVRRFVESGVAASGGGLSHFAATLAHATLEMGLLRQNIETLRRVYGQRHDDVAGLLRAEFGETVHFTPPGGGYFYWLTFSDGLNTDALLPAARESGVSYRPGAAFSASGGFADALRISISLYETDELAEGIRRLGRATRSGLH